MTVAICLVILALATFGPTWPVPSDSAHGKTISTQTPKVTAVTPQVSAYALTPTREPVPGEVPIIPGLPGGGGSAGGRCTIIVSPDDFIEPGTLLLNEIPVEALPDRDPNFSYLRACEVLFRDQSGVLIPVMTFAHPVTLCFPYADEDLVRAQGQVARLTTLGYDPVPRTWRELPVVLDEALRQVCGELPQTGIIALVVKSGRLSTLPDTSGNLPEITAAPTGAATPAPVGAVAAPGAGGPAPAAPTAPGSRPAGGLPGNPAATSVASPPQAPVAGQAARPGAPAGEDGSSGLIIVGLLAAVSVAVAAAVLVLSRSFLRRDQEK